MAGNNRKIAGKWKFAERDKKKLLNPRHHCSLWRNASLEIAEKASLPFSFSSRIKSRIQRSVKERL